MIIHYLKIAFRNLRKYRTQNFISIIGLAVGFACFAFSALWIRYEMSYDNFHPKADRIYRVHINRLKWTTVGDYSSETGRSGTPFPLAGWLVSNYPEIEDACNIQSRKFDQFTALYADYSFCNIFDMKIPEEIFIQGRTDRAIALTNNHKGATEAIKEQHEFDVHTLIPRWKANTNIRFDMVVPITLNPNAQMLESWLSSMGQTFVLIKNGVDIRTLEEKLDKVELPERQNMNLPPTVTLNRPPVSLVLTPLKQLRYNDPTGNMESDIKFSHIQIFAIAGLLVILCSLFNHLTLYVTRVRMRLRELALRKVNGATDWQIAATLYTDFMLVIVLSLVVGFIFMALFLPTFKEYASIGNNNIGIYGELTLYAAMLIGCGIVCGGIPVLYFRKQVLNESIKGYGSPGSGNLFRKVCLFLQLVISLGLMFCSAVFIKQINFLHHTDLGIDRRNVGAFQARCCPLTPPYADRIRQIPGVMDALSITDINFLKDMANGTSSMSTINEDGERVTVTVFSVIADVHFFDFFGVKFIEGEGFSNEDGLKKVVYNETANKEMGENNPMSKNVVGVVHDFYLTPTTKAKPTQISNPFASLSLSVPSSAANPGPSSLTVARPGMFSAIAFRHEEGLRKQTQEAITRWMREEFSDQGEFYINFAYMDDIFEEYFKSERALLSLLSVMTLACILIAVFGVYSLASLSCQQRRKEIAIRKINGAETVDITNIFFKEYLLMLFLAALAAFPVGFAIMKRWLEGYVKQTSMDAWLYVLIFLIVFVVIVFSIVSMVWKAANQNPAEVVKGE